MAELRTPTPDHAIESMAFAVHLDGQIKGAGFRHLKSELGPQLKDRLPLQKEKQKVTFSFDEKTGVGAQSTAEQEVGGLAFMHMLPDGRSETALVIEPDWIAVIWGAYRSWAENLEGAEQLLSKAFEVAQAHVKAKSLGLQYEDRFFWDGSVEEFDQYSVFRKGSHFVPLNALESGGLWHSHNGFMRGEQLVNLNVSLKKSKKELEIVIASNHRIEIGVTGFEDLFSSGNFGKRFAEMHETNKEVMQHLLSDEICERINLGKPNA